MWVLFALIFLVKVEFFESVASKASPFLLAAGSPHSFLTSDKQFLDASLMHLPASPSVPPIGLSNLTEKRWGGVSTSINSMQGLAEPRTAAQKRYAEWMYASLYHQFDVEGYNSLLDSVLSKDSQLRFTESLERLRLKLPHCDAGDITPPQPPESMALFPGGPMRRNYGFDLTQWITSQMMEVANSAGAANPVVGMMAMMAVTSVIGVVSTVLASVIDIVPPMIPPPIWILRPFPCLPMLTGMNCLLSVLYPITIADFMVAHVTDQIMNGVINSFPAKYNAKVGKSSNAVYTLCATVYLGMFCASIFPMCWLPVGLMEAQSFPVCFPQCLLVLVSCPGFWLDDIAGPCTSISVPPFCSFSVFINRRLIPPQYTNFEDQHPYPQDCPKLDPNYDIPTNLYDIVPPGLSPITKAAEEEQLLPFISPGKSLIHSLDEFNVVSPVHRVCDCSKVIVCSAATPGGCSGKKGVGTECEKSCAAERAISSTTTRRPLLKKRVVIHVADADTDRQLDKRGHVIPVLGAT